MQGGPKPRAGTLNKVILPRTGGRNDLLPKAAFWHVGSAASTVTSELPTLSALLGPSFRLQLCGSAQATDPPVLSQSQVDS